GRSARGGAAPRRRRRRLRPDGACLGTHRAVLDSGRRRGGPALDRALSGVADAAHPPPKVRCTMRSVVSGSPRETDRLRLRRRLLVWSAPVAFVVLMAVLKCVSVVLAGNSAVSSFEARDPAALGSDVAV